MTRHRHPLPPRLAVFLSLGLGLTLGLALSGCTPPGLGGKNYADPHLGDAVRHDMAAQIINAHPAFDQTMPPTDGTVIDSALGRYQTGKVLVPQSTPTSSVMVPSVSPSR